MTTKLFNGIYQPQMYDQNTVDPNMWEQQNNAANWGSYGGPESGFNRAGDPLSGWGSKAMGQGIALGMGGLQAINGGMQAYLGMKNYGLAKETLASNKEQYWNNYTNQARLTNTQLRDRQNGRVAMAQSNNNPGAVQSTDEYMKENSVKEEGYRHG